MRHSEWTGFLTKAEYASYREAIRMRRWCRDVLKTHEATLLDLEIKAKRRRAAVKQSEKEAAE